MEEYNTAGDGVFENYPSNFFAYIIDGFLSSTRNVGGKIGNSQSYVLETKSLLAYAKDIMTDTYKSASLRAVRRSNPELPEFIDE